MHTRLIPLSVINVVLRIGQVERLHRSISLFICRGYGQRILQSSIHVAHATTLLI
jgi:hypothetical protein